MAALKGDLQQPLYVIRKIPSDCIGMLKEHIIGSRHVQSRLPDEQDHVAKYQLRLSGVVWSLNEVTAGPWHQHMGPC